jgi:hypothetical protein
MKQTIILGNIITMDESLRAMTINVAQANIIATIVDGEEVFKA